MADSTPRGGGDEREIRLTKIAGASAAFILLVMWMTPPTTPHAMAPSPMDRIKAMRSDAPTRDPLAGPGDFSNSVAPLPWFSLGVPTPRRIADERIEGPAFVWPDDPPAPRAYDDSDTEAAQEEPVAVAPPPVAVRIATRPDVRPERRETWQEEMARQDAQERGEPEYP